MADYVSTGGVRRPPLGVWCVNSVNVPLANLERTDDDQFRVTSYMKSDVAVSDCIRFHDADKIMFGQVKRIKRVDNTFVFEVLAFRKASEHSSKFTDTPRQLIATNDLFDVAAYNILNKVQILHQDTFLQFYPDDYNVEVLPADHPTSKRSVCPDPDTYYVTYREKEDGTLYENRQQAFNTRLPLPDMNTLFFRNMIRKKASGVHSHRYPAPRYVRPVSYRGGVYKTVGNLAFNIIKNMPGNLFLVTVVTLLIPCCYSLHCPFLVATADVASALLGGMHPARRRGKRAVYKSPQSFDSLEELQELFGYSGLPWYTKDHQDMARNVTSFVPADSLHQLEMVYDGRTQASLYYLAQPCFRYFMPFLRRSSSFASKYCERLVTACWTAALLVTTS